MPPSFVFGGRPCNSTTWKFCWAGTNREGKRGGPQHHPFVAVSRVMFIPCLTQCCLAILPSKTSQIKLVVAISIRNLGCGANVAVKEWSVKCSLWAHYIWSGINAWYQYCQNWCSSFTWGIQFLIWSRPWRQVLGGKERGHSYTCM